MKLRSQTDNTLQASSATDHSSNAALSNLMDHICVTDEVSDTAEFSCRDVMYYSGRSHVAADILKYVSTLMNNSSPFAPLPLRIIKTGVLLTNKLF